MNQCLRCQHEWEPRTERVRQCPNCKSPRWNKPVNPQSKAGRLVAEAIKDGRLPRLNGDIRCMDCGTVATVYDHRDYSNPLEVEPVCHACNLKRGSAVNFTPVRGQISIRVEDADLTVLAQIAIEKRSTVSQLIREAIARLIEQQQGK